MKMIYDPISFVELVQKILGRNYCTSLLWAFARKYL